MSRTQTTLFRAAITFVAGIVGFCLGFIATAAYCNLMLVPGWVKQYPHDGQIGLAVFVYGLNGGLVVGLIALLAGAVWTVKGLRSRPHADSDPIRPIH